MKRKKRKKRSYNKHYRWLKGKGKRIKN